MDNERSKFDSVYSSKIKAGKRRTYFFDVRQTKGKDYYVTLTESTRRYNGDGYERHKIFLYKEDFNRFLDGLEDVINHVKTELLPDYDYDEFTRRHEEYEKSLKEQENGQDSASSDSANEAKSEEGKSETSEQSDTSDGLTSEDDMTW